MGEPRTTDPVVGGGSLVAPPTPTLGAGEGVGGGGARCEGVSVGSSGADDRRARATGTYVPKKTTKKLNKQTNKQTT